MRRIYLLAGFAAIGLGVMGVFVPIMPTVPFLVLAAWCFGKSNPAWEQRLLAHPLYGPHILSWRERGAIAPAGKYGATLAFGVSIGTGFYFLEWPWPMVPVVVAALVLGWIWTRPDP